jgi:undecaprenyl-phosphate 4-deoxy-4-formamido-L-arabinose transferase
MAFGLGLLAFVVGSYFVTGQPLSIFRFLAAVLAIFSGAQLFTLGILGEYVARIHHRVLREPSYVVRERIGDPDDGGA